jgi:hypothetical protein
VREGAGGSTAKTFGVSECLADFGKPSLLSGDGNGPKWQARFPESPVAEDGRVNNTELKVGS